MNRKIAPAIHIKPSTMATKRDEKIQLTGFRFDATELRALPIPEVDGKLVELELTGVTVEGAGVEAVAASLPELIDGRVRPSLANDCKLAKSVSKRLILIHIRIGRQIKPCGTIRRIPAEIGTFRLARKRWNCTRIARCQISHRVIPLPFKRAHRSVVDRSRFT